MARTRNPASTAAVAAWLGLVIGLPAYAQAVPDDALINKLIPQRPGKTVCFAGDFDDVPLDEEHVTPPPTRDGVATYRFTTHRVRRAVLQLEYARMAPHPDSDAPGHDRLYTFTLAVHLADRKGPLHAAGHCDWRNHDFKTKDGVVHVPRTTSALECGIECDGGGMTVERVKGTAALTLRLDPHQRLRMTASCGGGFRNIVFDGRDEGREFRLMPTAAQTCRPLKRWLSKQ